MSTRTDVELRTGNANNRTLPNVEVHFPAAPTPVLCVGLDGILIKSDLPWECILLLLKTAPWLFFMAPFWLSGGAANLKRELAKRSSLRPFHLPFRSESLKFPQAERASGRVIVVIAASRLGIGL